MQLELKSETQTKDFGAKLGALLGGGECIELIGDVGAGKTTLTKGIAKGLGISETVQSPTFTINRTYETERGVILSHYDFYRLSDPGIMADELAESLSDASIAIVIEWGDIVADILPSDHLTLTITSPTETGRLITLRASGPKSENLVRALV